MSTVADTGIAGYSSEPVSERLSDVALLPKTERHDFIERAWRFCCSTRLMVVLMAMFAAGMAAGTFLNPKDDSLAQIERVFADRPMVIWLYHAFELYAPFKSWWFTSIILALALNNLASSIERLPRIFLIVRNPERQLKDTLMRGMRNKRTVPRGSLTEEGIQSTFESAGYRVTRIVDGATTYLFGERGSWTRFGVWVVHLALLIICFGGIVGRLFAFEGTMEIPADGGRLSAFLERMPDGTILRHPLEFAVQCNQFHLDKFKDGSPRRYASDLAVYDLHGEKILDKHIIVNDPLDYDGMKFYQATFTERPDASHVVMTLSDNATGETKSVEAEPGQMFSMGSGRIRYQVVDYKPEYGELGAAVQVIRQEDPPIAPVGVTAPKQDPAETSFWVFKNNPDFDKKFRGDVYGLKFDSLQPSYFTGIQVARDPGVPWIYVGCFILWTGLFVAFWTVHRRVWARIEPDKIVLAGAAHRNKEVFSDEFAKLLVNLGVPPASPKAAG